MSRGRRILILIPSLVLFLVLLLWWLIMNPTGTPAYQSPLDSASAQKLEEVVRTLAGMPRESNDINGQAKVLNYLEKEWKAAGAVVERQPYAAKIGRVENLMTSFGPRAAPRIIIGAHYDTDGRRPGADDNASGVAGVTELIRLFKKRESQLKYRVDLVAYALEEMPFFFTDDMGSRFHARSLLKEKAKVELMVSLEMIGFFSDQKNSQSYPVGALSWLYPNEGNFIAVVGRLGDRGLVAGIKKGMKRWCKVPTYSINAPTSLEGIAFSDHSSYWLENIPAVMVTDTAFFRNKNYHTDRDTPERLNYVKMAEVVNGVFGTILNWR